DLPRRDDDLLRVPAAREEGADLVADGMALDTVAHRGDPAVALEPEHLGCPGWGRVQAPGLEQVRAVDRRGRDLDQDLARPGGRVGDLGDVDRFGTVVVLDCPHEPDGSRGRAPGHPPRSITMGGVVPAVSRGTRARACRSGTTGKCGRAAECTRLESERG